jgi:hypothetical protein
MRHHSMQPVATAPADQTRDSVRSWTWDSIPVN